MRLKVSDHGWFRAISRLVIVALVTTSTPLPPVAAAEHQDGERRLLPPPGRQIRTPGGTIATRIEIVPEPAGLCATQTQQFSVNFYDAAGGFLGSRTQAPWVVSSGTITPEGLYAAPDAGLAAVTLSVTFDETLTDTITFAVPKVAIDATSPRFVFTGDRITLTATAAPPGGTTSWRVDLPALASVTAATGELTGLDDGTPAVEADYQLAGTTCSSGPFPVTVNTAGFADGQVRHAITEAPMAGAVITVEGLDETFQTTSDLNGFYAIRAPSGSAIKLTVTKPGFTLAQRQCTLIPTRDDAVKEVFLTPLDATTALITPQAGGTLVDSTGQVEVVFPPDAVAQETVVSATPIPAERALPGELPRGVPYLGIPVDLHPSGLQLTVPAVMRLPNGMGLAPGTEIAFGSWNTDALAWDPIGVGIISADGTKIEMPITHFSLKFGGCHGIPPPTSSPAVPAAQTAETLSQPTNCPGSQIGLKEGSVLVDYALPTVRRLNTPQGLVFTYDSTAAYPTAVLASKVDLDDSKLTPGTSTAAFSFEGQRRDVTFLGTNQPARQALWLEAKNGRGLWLPTGSYPYTMQFSNNYTGSQLFTTNFFGGPPIAPMGAVSPVAEPQTMPVSGRVIVTNLQGSPFGAGWWLAGFQRLHQDPDGTVVVMQGDGQPRLFRPAKRLAGYGDPENSYGIIISSTFGVPAAVAFDAQGNLYAAVSTFVLKATPQGQVTTWVNFGSGGISGMVFDSQGNALIANNSRLYRVTPSGSATILAQPAGGFGGPLAIDQQDHVYGVQNQRIILEVDPNGTATTFTTGIEAGAINGLTVGPDGLLYGTQVPLPDQFGNQQGFNRVFRVAPSHAIETVATGVVIPAGLVFDRQGNLLIADGAEQSAGMVFSKVFQLLPTGEQVPVVYTKTGGGNGVSIPWMGSVGRLGDAAIDPVTGTVAIAAGFGGGAGTIEGTAALLVDQSDVYLPPLGDASALRRLADGTFTLRTKHGTVSTFDDQGLLQSITDRNNNATTYAYTDANGDGRAEELATITDPTGAVTTFGYTVDGFLDQVTDPAGRTTQFAVDPATAELRAITAPDLGVTQFAYDARRLLQTRTDPGNVVTAYDFDEFGRVRSESFPATGETRRFVPEATQAVVNTIPPGSGTPANPAPFVSPPQATETDGEGHTTTFTVNAQGGATSMRDPVGRLTTFSRDETGEVTTLIPPNGAPNTLTYDWGRFGGAGNLRLIAPRIAGSFAANYEATFAQPTAISFGGRNFSFVLDSRGNAREIWTPSGIGSPGSSVTRLTYNSRGQVETITDHLSHTTTFAYDSATGNLLTVTDPLLRATTLTYDAAGNVTSSRDALNRATTFTYDAANRLTSVLDADNRLTQYAYDGAGNLMRVTDANLHATTFAYSSVGLLTQVTDPLLRATAFTYDRNRNLTTATDRNGAVTVFDYDAANQLIQKLTPDGLVTFVYDAMGQLVGARDGDSATSFTHDASGLQRLLRTDAGGDPYADRIVATSGTPTNPQNLLGATNGITVVNPGDERLNHALFSTLGDAVTVEFVDNLLVDGPGDDLTIVSSTGAGPRLLNIVVSADGLTFLPISPSSPSGPVTYNLASTGLTMARFVRLTHPGVISGNSTRLIDSLEALNTTYPVFSQPKTRNAYTYSEADRTTLNDPANGTTTYSYESGTRHLLSVTNPAGLLTRLTYDKLDRRATLTHANNVVATYSFDNASQLVGLVHQLGTNPALALANYTYDNVGNRLTASSNQPSAISNYTYDALNRLTSATHPTLPPESFTYDGVGNRLTAISNQQSAISNYLYDTANRLLDDGTLTYTYDNNGNRLTAISNQQSAVSNYLYDADNQLTGITFPDGSQATYAYDALGRRIQKTVNGTATRFVYDNEDLLMEYDGTNTLRARVTHGPGIDEPLSLERDLDLDGTLETRIFYHTDGLGSTVALTNPTGQVVERYRYASFGNPTILGPGPDGLMDTPDDVTLACSAYGNPYLFTGREYDCESGLYYYRARYLDPQTGTFLQEDPLAGGRLTPQSQNKYPYVVNNPINRIDPSGELSPAEIVTIIGVALFALALTRFACEVSQTPGGLEQAALEGVRKDPEAAEEAAQALFNKSLSQLTREELIEVGKHTPEFKNETVKRGWRLIERAIDVESSSVPTP
ncbi:MAG: hypothetical protein HY597_00595 [Candidatus Omnitrophica bacterium]|nr:hypothetical protein [Candidatus Omnitrophota bacterium]